MEQRQDKKYGLKIGVLLLFILLPVSLYLFNNGNHHLFCFQKVMVSEPWVACEIVEKIVDEPVVSPGSIKNSWVTKWQDTLTPKEDAIVVAHPVAHLKMADIKPLIQQDVIQDTLLKNRKITTIIDFHAMFVGGEQSMYQYLHHHMKYPRRAINAHTQGRVVIKFMVNHDSTLSDFTVLDSLPNGCTQEAMRVIRQMPKWIPAQRFGVNIDSEIELPIIFRLPANNDTVDVDEIE